MNKHKIIRRWIVFVLGVLIAITGLVIFLIEVFTPNLIKGEGANAGATVFGIGSAMVAFIVHRNGLKKDEPKEKEKN